MYNSLEWYNDPCHCPACAHLRISFDSTYEAVHKTDKRVGCFQAIVNAAVAIGEAAEALHRAHKPESYLPLARLRATNPLGDSEQELDSRLGGMSIASSPVPEPTDNKFMVCDHCMMHGLVCDEASYCQQCQNYKVPCVHRWCKDNPQSKDDCPNAKCHYAHMDSIPHKENEPKWIIYRGDLPIHLERGRLPTLPVEELDYATGSKDWVKLLNVRQEDAIKIFTDAVNNRQATYEGNYIECRCKGVPELAPFSPRR